MKMIIPALLAFLLLSAMAKAQYTQDYCVGNTLMHFKYTLITVPETNKSRTLNTTEPEFCDYGCSDNRCNPAPIVIDMWIIGGIIGFILVVITVLKVVGRI